MKKLFLAAATLAALLALAPAAGAVIYVKGSGEPAFTNTTTNTQWVDWQGSSSYDAYQVEFDFYDNSVFKKTETVAVSRNGSGSLWANWGGIVDTLQEGHTYGICGYGRYWIGGIPSRDTGSCFDATQTGKRASTTIDRTKPSIAVKIDNGAAFSRTAKLNYNINYSDNLAFPFPANFLCRDIGTDPASACTTTTHQYNEACSVPLGGMSKTTYFNCDEDLSGVAGLGDVPVTLCVVSADAAIPDNPSSDNQAQGAHTANLSNRTCDSIQLDRTAPAVTIGTASTSVQVGDLVNVSAQASDATSGLSGTYAWTWGDNTAAGAGQAASHTFTAPGTYSVSVVTKDNAGNETSATKVITVNPRQTTGTGTGTGTGTTSGSGVTTAPPTISGPKQTTEVAGLDVLAPKRLKLGKKAATLAIALTSEGAGSASLAFVRGGRVHAQGAAKIASAGTLGYKLRLPKKLKAGAYQLKISFQPAGAAKATTKTIKVTLVGAKKKKAGKASAASVTAPRIDVASAPVDVPTGEAPQAPRSRDVRLPLR